MKAFMIHLLLSTVYYYLLFIKNSIRQEIILLLVFKQIRRVLLTLLKTNYYAYESTARYWSNMIMLRQQYNIILCNSIILYYWHILSLFYHGI